jgi:hypothetical protein
MKRQHVVGVAVVAVAVSVVGLAVARHSGGTTTGRDTIPPPTVAPAIAPVSPSSTAPTPTAPGDLHAAAATALRWVASTGELLGMGPIRRHDVLAASVSSDALPAIAANLERDLGRLADRLPIPASELRLVEVPLTVDAAVGNEGTADIRVWSVVLFGAEGLGAPRVVWRTSHLTLVWENAAWKLAGFTTTEGPTPAAGDGLPADWADFVTVTGWRPSVEGVA